MLHELNDVDLHHEEVDEPRVEAVAQNQTLLLRPESWEYDIEQEWIFEYFNIVPENIEKISLLGLLLADVDPIKRQDFDTNFLSHLFVFLHPLEA